MDRRRGTTIFWEFFWKIIHGERRSGQERRQSKADCIVYGCQGKCVQGRRQCDGRPFKKE